MIKGLASRRAVVVRRITGVCGIISQLVGITALLVAAITASQMTWGLLSITAGVLVAAPHLVLGPLSGGAIAQLLSCLPWSLWTIAFGIMLLVSPIPLEHSK